MCLMENLNYRKSLANIELKAHGSSYHSTTKHSKGFWYFEYSHRYGNASYMVGFSNAQCEITVHPFRKYPMLYTYLTGSISIVTNDDHEFSCEYRYNDRIGIAIDIDNKKLYILKEDMTETLSYETTYNIEWSLFMRESQNDGYSDLMDIFLSEEYFRYRPPEGAYQWYSNNIKTCFEAHTASKSLIIIYLLLIKN